METELDQWIAELCSKISKYNKALPTSIRSSLEIYISTEIKQADFKQSTNKLAFEERFNPICSVLKHAQLLNHRVSKQLLSSVIHLVARVDYLSNTFTYITSCYSKLASLEKLLQQEYAQQQEVIQAFHHWLDYCQHRGFHDINHYFFRLIDVAAVLMAAIERSGKTEDTIALIKCIMGKIEMGFTERFDKYNEVEFVSESEVRESHETIAILLTELKAKIGNHLKDNHYDKNFDQLAYFASQTLILKEVEQMRRFQMDIKDWNLQNTLALINHLLKLQKAPHLIKQLAPYMLNPSDFEEYAPYIGLVLALPFNHEHATQISCIENIKEIVDFFPGERSPLSVQGDLKCLERLVRLEREPLTEETWSNLLKTFKSMLAISQQQTPLWHQFYRNEFAFMIQYCNYYKNVSKYDYASGPSLSGQHRIQCSHVSLESKDLWVEISSIQHSSDMPILGSFNLLNPHDFEAAYNKLFELQSKRRQRSDRKEQLQQLKSKITAVEQAETVEHTRQALFNLYDNVFRIECQLRKRDIGYAGIKHRQRSALGELLTVMRNTIQRAYMEGEKDIYKRETYLMR